MNEIPEFQETSLNFCRKINPVLKMLINNKEDGESLIKENISIIKSFATMLEKMVVVFKYEQYYDTVAYICDIVGSMGEELDNDVNKEEVSKMLLMMIDISDKILSEKTGKRRTCICCGQRVYYLSIPKEYEEGNEKYGGIKSIPETLNKEEYHCPACFSSDRDRLMIAFMKIIGLDIGEKRKRLLQIAPAGAIEYWLGTNCNNIEYESTDLFMDGVTFKSDIQNMDNVEDERYDYIICSHVLEHVQDDRRAMKEMLRILKPDGIVLFLVPISLNVSKIDEEWGLSEEENWRRFGQGDHCRLYSKTGLVDRLKEVGFDVDELGIEYFGEELFRECGLTDTSVLYALTKKGSNIEI